MASMGAVPRRAASGVLGLPTAGGAITGGGALVPAAASGAAVPTATACGAAAVPATISSGFGAAAAPSAAGGAGAGCAATSLSAGTDPPTGGPPTNSATTRPSMGLLAHSCAAVPFMAPGAPVPASGVPKAALLGTPSAMGGAATTIPPGGTTCMYLQAAPRGQKPFIVKSQQFGSSSSTANFRFILRGTGTAMIGTALPPIRRTKTFPSSATFVSTHLEALSAPRSSACKVTSWQPLTSSMSNQPSSSPRILSLKIRSVRRFLSDR
mmetsp:Transcript_61712/g.198862  ORF Transcript_61712/g.198862 Transcript_61712/m.198862 type:complete len:267 (+) Transcript_61712:835-1635(+)